MITVKRAGLGSYRLVRNSLKSFNPDSCKFYSELEGPYMLYILRKDCWYIMKDSSLVGLIFSNPSKHQVYYVPLSPNPLSFMGASFLIKKYTNTAGYTLKLTYRSASFNAASTYLKVKPVSDVKYMCCYLPSLSFEKPSFPDGVKIQSMNKGEEVIRVELQNSIFGGIKNRIPLQLDEVLEEQKFRGYIGSMCYILWVNNAPSGYGQIMANDGIYSLINFGIIPSCRGQGYGDMLLKHILLQCKSCSIESVQLTVDNNNPEAIALYKKNYFIELYNTADLVL